MQIDTTTLERFWSKVHKTETCWIWSAHCNPVSGYGQFWFQGKDIGAHIASWIIHFGVPPDRQQVLHKCDNRPCVRPEHLFTGTHLDNMLDMAAKGRNLKGEKWHKHCDAAQNQGEKHGRAKLTDEQAMLIRYLYQIGFATQTQLAKQFKISITTVSELVNYRHWKHLP